MNGRSMMAAGVGLLLLQGCVLPVPFKTMHSATYRGKVLDAETKEPLKNARVELSSFGKLRDKAKTDEHGEFEVGPLYCWSWIGTGWPYYEGRFCRHEKLETGGKDRTTLPVVVSRRGYETTEIFVEPDYVGELIFGRMGDEEIRLDVVEDILLQPLERK